MISIRENPRTKHWKENRKEWKKYWKNGSKKKKTHAG